MGVNISDIIKSTEIEFKDIKGRVIAIDAYNTIYQFLSIIRQPDGTPLMDNEGRITSHLSGLFYRTCSLLEYEIKPVFVFDGKPSRLKKNVIEERMNRRAKAMEEWELAIEEQRIEDARKWAKQSSRLTKEMVEESKTLLDYMGIPWNQALSEGEAQASFMTINRDAYAVGSQDFDSLLFGAPLLLRNLTLSGKRKVPRKNIVKEIKPELIDLNQNLKELGLTREQLVDIGVLVGTDFNEGVKNIGPKRALALIKEYISIERIENEKNITVENYQEIRDIFLKPEVGKSYKIEWKDHDEQKIYEFMCEIHNFSRDRVAAGIEKLKNFKKARSQRDLSRWF